MLRKAIVGVLVLVASALTTVQVSFGFNPDTDESLVGWWKMDDGSGTVAADSSPNGSDAEFSGGPLWVAGHFEGALEFDGVDDCLVAPALNMNTDRATFTAWVWCNGIQTEYAAIMFCRGGGTISGLDFKPNNTMGYHWNDATWSYVGPAVPVNEWVFLALVVDPSQARFYMNTADTFATHINSNPVEPFSSSLYIGQDSQGGRWFKGRLDDCRVYKRDLTQDEIRAVMLPAPPGAAAGPAPSIGATDVPRDATLGWVAGAYAQTHDVYLGTSFEDVNTATRGSALLVSQGQTATTYDPAGLLDFGQTYYWRVDEVNAAPDNSIWKGQTWSFTAEPYAYPVTPVAAKSSTPYGAKMTAINTINGSGLDPDTDEHLTGQQYMWQSAKSPQPAWIQYDFDQVYKLHQMWVWNHNSAMEVDLGYGAKEVAIETSIDGTTWTALPNVPEFAQATGEPNYVHNTTVDFGGALAKHVKLTLLSNWSGVYPYRGLSEVRFFQAPLRAREPEPGAENVALNTVLNWRPGREAAQHEVYFGTDPNALALSKTVIDHQVALTDLGAEYDQTYYWKVNEVNTAAAVQSWEGQIWSLSMTEHGVVDDFDSYNDNCNRVYYAWKGGAGNSENEDCGVGAYSGNGTGSVVGNDDPPYCERTFVHGGLQSMPFSYDNTAGYATSEATRTFGPAQDWTRGGAKTLVLFFRGDPANGPGQLYVKINNTRVDYNGSAEALTRPLWRQWNIDLASVPGLQSVQSLSIGVSGSVRGKLLIDDILLYRTAPEVPVPVDPGTTGLSAYYTFEGNVQDSSGKGNHGTAVNDPTYQESWAGLGQALRLDGVNDHVDLPIGNLVGTLASATFATWVDFDTMSAGAWQRVFDFGTGSTAYMFLTPRQGTSGAMRFAITSSGNAAGAESILDAPTRLPEGWHHVAVVIDGATKAMLLYLDGEVLNRGPTNTLPMDLGVTTQNWLGRSQYDTDGYFGGALDEFRIYDRALSMGEVAYLAGDR